MHDGYTLSHVPQEGIMAGLICQSRAVKLRLGHLQVSLRDTIGAVVEMVAADASKKGLNIAYTIDEVLLRRAVLGDAIRIRQVKSEPLWLAHTLPCQTSVDAAPPLMTGQARGWHHDCAGSTVAFPACACPPEVVATTTKQTHFQP